MRSTGAVFTTDQLKMRIMARTGTSHLTPTTTTTMTITTNTPSSARQYSRTVSTPGTAATLTASATRKPFVSRFLGGGKMITIVFCVFVFV